MLNSYIHSQRSITKLSPPSAKPVGFPWALLPTLTQVCSQPYINPWTTGWLGCLRRENSIEKEPEKNNLDRKSTCSVFAIQQFNNLICSPPVAIFFLEIVFKNLSQVTANLVTKLNILGQVLSLSESQVLHPSTRDVCEAGTILLLSHGEDDESWRICE